ncbi:glycoside hydrolase family 3 C-terminal domain-containing protein [uncultured Gemmiger sp.]|uniref:glycoside hydrolase family 3 C-terminal domain-containing protein n=1 Tax=uncultured Gemmiger sp. TaxID=1623490 RepID=UPI0025F06CC7|nr:glycoside hydrolase family 3 C-terminal domain-containing protein [uncultured Gemmiger sp.]
MTYGREDNTMQKKPKVTLWSILTALCAVLTVAALVATFIVAPMYETTVNVALNAATYRIIKGDTDEDTNYFTSDFASNEEREAYEAELCATVEAEGAALLMNNNSALPLASGAKVSLFARGSVDLMYGGTGSGSVDTSAAPTLKDALEAQGIEVNPTLWDWYTSESVAGKYSRVTPAAISDALAANSEYDVNEAPWSEVESNTSSSFADYGDAAIVVFSRSGGEGADLPSGDNGSGVEWTGPANYLELSQEEKDLLAGLKALKDAGTFKSIVVLLNTSNALELDFLNPEICGTDYGIDACLWVGDVGQTGANGVGQILSGAANPSGSIVDTFWYDNLANPAVTNFYSRPYPNNADYGFIADDKDNGNQGYYVVYQEGVYLGYRYAETRYEDYVMGTGNAGNYSYGTTVAYPFGYGTSYTTFDLSNYTVTDNGDAFEVNVTVTNTGSVAGKKTVQVYFQSPYTQYDKDNGIEKASAELCGFDKTEILEPGASETLTISVPKSELRTYDANGAKTYILDAGDYYFTVANGAHEAVNNILAAKGYTVESTEGRMDADGNANLTWKWTNAALDTTTFATSEATGNAITNLFDDADPNKVSYSPGQVTWLSRSDWTGTYPTGTFDFALNDDLAAALANTQYDGSEASSVEMPTTGADGDLTLASMIGADYDDPQWESLLDQVTFDEMNLLITQGFHNTKAVASIGKTATKDENGPQGLTAALTGGASAMCYTSEDVMAATFNTDLINDVGRCIGEDCLAMGYSGLYGPGINMHRTPYSGRNFEYYSEDPFIAGTICAAEVQGIQSKGVYVYLKHVALNDSESSRMGVNTWLNEQTAREIYLEVADKAVVDGGAWCTMSGFNRWGATWCGKYQNLQTDYLRGELGMRGMSITDYSGGSHYMDSTDALIAGTEIWDSPTPLHTEILANYENDAYIVSMMREATHKILYTVANSNAMNGWSSADRLEVIIPWWKLAAWAMCAVLAVLTVICAVMLKGALKKKRANTNKAS